jgi:hypothetical protein
VLCPPRDRSMLPINHSVTTDPTHARSPDHGDTGDLTPFHWETRDCPLTEISGDVGWLGRHELNGALPDGVIPVGFQREDHHMHVPRGLDSHVVLPHSRRLISVM